MGSQSVTNTRVQSMTRIKAFYNRAQDSACEQGWGSLCDEGWGSVCDKGQSSECDQNESPACDDIQGSHIKDHPLGGTKPGRL